MSKPKPAPKVIQITSLSSLSGYVGKSRTIKIPIEGSDNEVLELTMRPLTVKELQECEAYTDILPPEKARAANGAPDYDWDNPAYKAALAAAHLKRTVAMIQLSTGLTFTGATLDEQIADYQALPASVARMLADQVDNLSSRSIAVLANFSSAPGSESSPS